jgi:hypothetical protein
LCFDLFGPQAAVTDARFEALEAENEQLQLKCAEMEARHSSTAQRLDRLERLVQQLLPKAQSNEVESYLPSSLLS